MASKKRESFVLTSVPEDLGVMQYGFGKSSKKGINAKTGERKKVWRSPAAIFLYAVAAFLLFWFLYTLITDIMQTGAQAILSHLVDLFALFVCILIIFLSMFKLWGKFGRFALRHNLVRNNERAGVEDSVEMIENNYEKLEEEPPVFEVYENYVRATDGKVVKTFDRAHIGKITACRLRGRCYLVIEADEESRVETVWLFDVKLPLREVKKLKAFFGDKLVIESPHDSDGEEDRKSRLEDLRESLSDVNWPGVIMGLIAVAAGAGVMALHYTVEAKIPVALGAFFLLGGVLITCTGISYLPVVKVFILPLLFGVIFITIPYQFCKLIAGEESIEYLFSSAYNFFTSFSAVYCAVVFFAAIGGLAIIAAVTGLIKYIKYGEE